MKELVVLLAQLESRPGPWMQVNGSKRATISIQGLEQDGVIYYEVEQPLISVPLGAPNVDMELIPNTRWRVRKVAGENPLPTQVRARVE